MRFWMLLSVTLAISSGCVTTHDGPVEMRIYHCLIYSGTTINYDWFEVHIPTLNTVYRIDTKQYMDDFERKHFYAAVTISRLPPRRVLIGSQFTEHAVFLSEFSVGEDLRRHILDQYKRRETLR